MCIFSRMPVVVSAVFFVSSAVVVGLAIADPPASVDMGNAPAGWVDEMRGNIDKQVERFASAYSLTPEAKEALRMQMVARLPDQWRFESAGFNDLGKSIEDAVNSGANLEDNNSDASKAILEKLNFVCQIGPLADTVVASSLIEPNLSKEVANDGRQRLAELITREEQLSQARDNDLDDQAVHNGALAAARDAAVAPSSTQGDPLPRGEKLDRVESPAVAKLGGDAVRSLPVVPSIRSSAPMTTNSRDAAGLTASKKDSADPSNGTVPGERPAKGGKADAASRTERSAKLEKGASAQPPRKLASPIAEKPAGPPPSPQMKEPVRIDEVSRPMPTANTESVKLAPAPPLDDWDKHVDAVAKKYGFSGAQVIKAQSILRDLRQRAETYRKSRAEDFAAAERIADAKVKADRKKDLSQPFDGLFEELKQRLENLATMEQKAKSSEPPAKPTKR